MLSNTPLLLERNAAIYPDSALASTINSTSVQLLKYGVWAYFLLIIFEGALRKWFFPSLATPLLVIRDPLALWLLLATWKRGLLPANPYMTIMLVIGGLSLFTAALLGHGSLTVALFGARILFLHFPLIFVIGQVFNRDDVLKIGKFTLWLAVPMVVLIAVQFYSPQSAFVNRGIGGDLAGAGFDGALGFFRPPGTFSFTTGNASYFSMLALFLFYFWVNNRSINKLLLLLAALALVVAIPLCVSRTLLFQLLITLGFLLIAVAQKPTYWLRTLLAAMAVLIVLTLLEQTSFFTLATKVFSTRFETANKIEGGLQGVVLDRFLGGMLGPLTGSARLPFFGYGIGMGTNVGSMLLSGTRTFLIAEEEWGRIVGELGPLMGIGVIFIRVKLAWKLTVACYQRMTEGDLLPWMLLSFGLLNLVQGGWAQPTSLGFCTLISGLIIASFRLPAPRRVA